MRISDWSSDVCSSDLPCQLLSQANGVPHAHPGRHRYRWYPRSCQRSEWSSSDKRLSVFPAPSITITPERTHFLVSALLTGAPPGPYDRRWHSSCMSANKVSRTERFEGRRSEEHTSEPSHQCA